MIKFFLYHTTIYSYTNPVIESTNKILLYPYNDLFQQLVNHRLTISGNPNVSSYIDDYNNRVGFFTYTPPHTSLAISSEAEIIVPLASNSRQSLSLVCDSFELDTRSNKKENNKTQKRNFSNFILLNRDRHVVFKSVMLDFGSILDISNDDDDDAK